MAKLRHIAMSVPDPQQSAKFYCEALGMTVVGEANSATATGVYLSDGTISLALLKYRTDQAAVPTLSIRETKQADPLSRVTGPRMNPSVDVGCPPRPFRHLRMAQRRTPDPSSSRAPVHSALVQKSVTRHHQPGRPAFNVDARENARSWQVEERK